MKNPLKRIAAIERRLAEIEAATKNAGAERPTLHCAFCVKSQHEVHKLIAGRAAFICNECVAICVEVLAAPAPSRESA